MDNTTALINAKLFANEVYKEFTPCKVMLFGSLAHGNFTESSDIDIAVIKDSIDGDYLDLSKKLNRLTRPIDNRIEPILLQANQDQSGFITTIFQTGIRI